MQVEQQATKKVVKKVAAKKAPEAVTETVTDVAQDLATTDASVPTSVPEAKKAKVVKKKSTVSQELTSTEVKTETDESVKTTEVTPVQEVQLEQSAATEELAAPSTEGATTTEVVLEVPFDTFHQTFLNAIDKFTEAYNQLKLVSSLNKGERKSIVKARKDFSKVYDNFNNALLDSAEKQLITAEKGGAKKQVKRAVDKEKAAIHKPRVVDNKLIEFMGLPEGSQVSRAQALQAINAYVNELKTTSPEMVKVADNNKAFKVAGKLESLFANQLNKEDESKMPDVIKYTDIMKYMSEFFPKITV
jgi:hypothetical protein